jgi:hypothetical protein
VHSACCWVGSARLSRVYGGDISGPLRACRFGGLESSGSWAGRGGSRFATKLADVAFSCESACKRPAFCVSSEI